MTEKIILVDDDHIYKKQMLEIFNLEFLINKPQTYLFKSLIFTIKTYLKEFKPYQIT